MSKSQPRFYYKWAQQLDNYHFGYLERRQTDIHESHLSRKALLVVRVVAFVYLSVIYVWALLQMPTINTNIIYLTMNGYALTWLYFGLSIQHYLFNQSLSLSVHLSKFIEIIHQMAFCAQVPITLVFWTLLFKYVLAMDGLTTGILIVQCNLHSVPFIFLTIDLLLNPFSFHLRHTIFLVIFAVLYLFINMVYSLMVKPIYAVLKWRDVTSYILAVGCLVAVVLVHFVARVIYRRWKSQKLKKGDQESNNLLKSQLTQITDDRESQIEKQNSAFRKSVDL